MLLAWNVRTAAGRLVPAFPSPVVANTCRASAFENNIRFATACRLFRRDLHTIMAVKDDAVQERETEPVRGNGLQNTEAATERAPKKGKLTGRAFYESIGKPKFVLAPMVDQSEFAWRLLSRSFLPPSKASDLLAYTPMFHSRIFADTPKYRDNHFQALKAGTLPSPPDPYHLSSSISPSDLYLDGNPAFDRPLFVQFCSNDPDDLLGAAKHVQAFCDAVDLNLGCPQGIARRGHYGAFLQEDQELIYKLISTLAQNLDVPVTAKMRILETKEKTLAYAKMILSAGASLITVHGRQRHQKGHETGVADWSVIRYLRENLPPETVIFANGNILQYDDIQRCLDATGADAVMSAEGNLYDPSIFAAPPPEVDGKVEREYWRGRDGKGGYRMDAVMRRYLDIIHRHVLGKEPPNRKPLWVPGDPIEEETSTTSVKTSETVQTQDPPTAPADGDDQPPAKRQKLSKAERKKDKQAQPRSSNPNLVAMQPHLFHLLRPLVSKHHNVRDALARSKSGGIEGFENVLSLVEKAVQQGLREYEADPASFEETSAEGDAAKSGNDTEEAGVGDIEHKDVNDEGGDNAQTQTITSPSSRAAVLRCKRPYFISQAYVRPLPNEALQKGSLTLSKKEKAKLEKSKEALDQKLSKDDGVTGTVEDEAVAG